jgi:hypothetical protein
MSATDHQISTDVFDGHGRPPPRQDPSPASTPDPFADPKGALVSINERLLDFARERPALALLGAVATGFFVGKLVARL